MTESAFEIATAWSYGLALAGYVAFAIRVAFGSRKSPRARLLLAALLATALWAASCIPVVLAPSTGVVMVSSAADALRYGVWFAFLWHLVARSDRFPASVAVVPRAAFVAVAAALIASVFVGNDIPLVDRLGLSAPRANYLMRLGLAVFGLMLVEHVVRRVQPQMRWGIKPLAVALAGVFGLDLFFYADAMLFGQVDPTLWVSRGFANVIVIPFLAIATARNTGWTVDLHLSRVAVFHSSALLVSGAFLLAVAGAGYFVRYVGGDWGRALQIELIFAAVLFAMLVASSGRFRAKLKVFVSKHFFSYRYDYREEWLRFTRTLSTETSAQNVQERTVMALADLVESPAGVLWLREEARGFVFAARWNMPTAVDAVERADGALALFLQRTGWIIDIAEVRANPSRYADFALPEWIPSLPLAWLIVPLTQGAELLGFVVLMAPRTALDVDWEVRDLLKTASRQAASYLGQIRASEALLEARKFDAFNRMSAFVVHDLKNLVAQLSLMLKNAKRHHDNPAFQADMLGTVEHVVERMNALMLQLRTGAEPVDQPRAVDLEAVVRRACAAKSDPRVPIAVESVAGAGVLGHADRLEHVIAHLVQNAIDASTPEGRVRIDIGYEGPFAVVVVTDGGIGMTPEFVRDRLFKPFETTKASGMGIGVYESSQYVASIGGEITVDSDPGRGTRVRVRLPRIDVAAAEALALKEQAA